MMGTESDDRPFRLLPSTKLWHFNMATFLVTQILFGVEGWPGWAISAVAGWVSTRNEPLGEKNHLLGAAVWALFTYIALGQRYDWY